MMERYYTEIVQPKRYGAMKAAEKYINNAFNAQFQKNNRAGTIFDDLAEDALLCTKAKVDGVRTTQYLTGDPIGGSMFRVTTAPYVGADTGNFRRVVDIIESSVRLYREGERMTSRQTLKAFVDFRVQLVLNGIVRDLQLRALKQARGAE